MSKHTIEVKKLPNARVEIRAVTPNAHLESYRDQALQSLNEHMEIDGFRPGKAPKDVVSKRVGDKRVLEEMASLVIADAYPTILSDEKIEALGRPMIVIRKLATGNDLEWSATTDVLPTITLGDYKKIAKGVFGKVEKVTVPEADIEKAILELRQMRAHQKMHEDGVEHDSHDHKEIDEKNLPPLDDAFAQSLGKFENLEAFKTKLRENLQMEHEHKAADERRARVMDEIMKASEIEIPEILVEVELEKMHRQFEHDISMMGQTMEEYLKHIKKTIEELRKTWHPHATDRAKIQLIVDKIATEEKIIPTDEEISGEVAKIMEQYKDHKDVSESRVSAYVAQMLTNKKVVEFLEKQNG